MREKIICLFIIFLFFGTLPAFSQMETAEKVLDRWFDANKNSAGYRTIYTALLAFLQQAAETQIPLELIIDILNQGASRRVKPEVLLEVLDTEISRFQALLSLLYELDSCLTFPFGNKAKLIDLLRDLALINRSGVSQTVLSQLLYFSCSKKIPYERTLSAFKAFIKIPAVASISDNEMVLLGRELLESDMPPANYAIISSIFLKGRINHISYTEIIEIIVTSLKDGKGLIQIEQEIARRGRK